MKTWLLIRMHKFLHLKHVRKCALGQKLQTAIKTGNGNFLIVHENRTEADVMAAPPLLVFITGGTAK